MLTQRHLALIRAALQYFDEELVPHGMLAWRPYLDDHLEGDVTSLEVQQLRFYLRQATVKYGSFDQQTGLMIKTRLADTIPGEAATNSVASTVTVSVLIPMGR